MYNRKAVGILVLVALMITVMVGCSSKDKYAEYKILGKEEEEYLAEIESCLELAYAPNPGVSSDFVRSILGKYMTEDVVDRLVKWQGRARGDAEAMVNYIGLAYGKHQRDGISRVLASISVRNGGDYWDLDVEMKINKDGKIYEISVY